MQDAKDSFYEVLRARLSVLNPERTVFVRGVSRPGLVVDENEVTSVALLTDCFHLRWRQSEVAWDGAMPVITMSGEIAYATAGSQELGGLDRGRALAAMDGELLSALCSSPQNAPKNDYSTAINGAPAAVRATRVWWSDPEMDEAKVNGGRISRAVRVQVMCLQEGGAA